MVESKKIQKKAFYEVKAPLTAAKIYLYGSSPASLSERVVKLDLTRSLRGKSFVLCLKTKLAGENLEAEPLSLEIAGSYIRRMMHKGADYVEDSFSADCRDSSVIVKPFLITRKKVSRIVRNALRTAARKHLEAYLKTRTTLDVFTEITSNKTQRELSLKLKKIYPLSFCEIRVFKKIFNTGEQTAAVKNLL